MVMCKVHGLRLCRNGKMKVYLSLCPRWRCMMR
jgi:hypothetical protein